MPSPTYLDLDGLTTYDGLIKAEISGKIDIGGRAGKIPFGRCDSTSTATNFTATVDGLTELTDGTCVMLENGVVTSATNFTLNVNGLGAKPVYTNLAAATRDTTIFNVAYTMLFVYDSQRVSGGAWVCYRGYDSNTNTVGYQLRTNNTVRNVSDTARYYKIYFTSANGQTWVPASVNSTNNATSARPVNQRPIDPFGPIVYTSANTNYAAGANLAAATIWEQYNLTLGYSFNRTGAALALTSERPVYVKCAPQADGSAIMDADEPIVQALPTSKDGKIYIYLGLATSATACELQVWHPVYWHDGTGIRLWTGAEPSGGGGDVSGKVDKVSTDSTTGSTLTIDNSGGYASIRASYPNGSSVEESAVEVGNFVYLRNTRYNASIVVGGVAPVPPISIIGNTSINGTLTISGAPTAASHAVTKSYADGLVVGLASYQYATVTIPTTGWSGGSITLSVQGATATNTVFVSPAPQSVAGWASAGIYCSAQGDGTLTFSCSSTPTASLSANVVMFAGGTSAQTFSIALDSGSTSLYRVITTFEVNGQSADPRGCTARAGDTVTGYISDDMYLLTATDASGNKLLNEAYYDFSFTMPESDVTLTITLD